MKTPQWILPVSDCNCRRNFSEKNVKWTDRCSGNTSTLNCGNLVLILFPYKIHDKNGVFKLVLFTKEIGFRDYNSTIYVSIRILLHPCHFLNFGPLPSKNYRLMPAHNNKNTGMPWTNGILQINVFIQSIIL